MASAPGAFSWAERRRNDQKDLDEFRRVEAEISSLSRKPVERLHVDNLRKHPKPKKKVENILVDRFYHTTPLHRGPGPDECRGLIPGLESRRELNAATKSELNKLHTKVSSLTSQLDAARMRIQQLEADAVAGEDCALLANKNAKLRERNRELVYQVKQGIERASTSTEEMQAERDAFNIEKAKFLKEVRKQKGDLDRQSQLLLQAQIPDRNVRDRVGEAESALTAFQDRSHLTISKLRAEISRQRVEIDQTKASNEQLRSELQAIEARRIQTWTSGENDSPSFPRRQTPANSAMYKEQLVQRQAETKDKFPYKVVHDDGRIVMTFANGRTVTEFPNGAVRTSDSDCIQMKFVNGDERKVFSDREEYRYAADNILHVTLTSGVQRFEFPNGQKEIHYIDGSKRIEFSDGTVKKIDGNGDYEVHYPNGLVHQIVGGATSLHYASNTQTNPLLDSN